jgi:hypothetical protein
MHRAATLAVTAQENIKLSSSDCTESNSTGLRRWVPQCLKKTILFRNSEFPLDLTLQYTSTANMPFEFIDPSAMTTFEQGWC